MMRLVREMVGYAGSGFFDSSASLVNAAAFFEDRSSSRPSVDLAVPPLCVDYVFVTQERAKPNLVRGERSARCCTDP